MPREGGRSCGCDPKADHVCDGHDSHVDESETVIESGRPGSGWSLSLEGPNRDGDFVLQLGPLEHEDSQLITFGRFVAEDLIEELQRRLRERA